MRKSKLLICIMMSLAITASSMFCTAKEADEKSSSSVLTENTSDAVAGSESSVDFSYGSADEMFDSMSVASVNDNYEMRYDPKTAAVAVKDLKTGSIYSTNAYNASKDRFCTGDIEKSLESQLVLTYIDVDERQKKLTLYSSSDCVEYGQYSYTTYKNGVKFSMTVGKDSSEQIAPGALTIDRYKELTSKMSERGKMKMEVFYSKYSLKSEKDADVKKELEAKYPALKNQDLYISIELSEREKKELEGYLKDAGYTSQDMAKDYETIGIKNEVAVSPTFSFDIEYVLTDSGIMVNIPNDSIKYNSQYQLLTVSLLENFGADKPTDGGDGYLFYPDGSGAVININNQDENRRTIISSSVYGFNAADEQDTSVTEGEQVYLPVFGIRRNDKSAFLAIIQNGDAVSEITAKLGAPNSEYYKVYNTFTYSSEKHIKMDSKVSSLGSNKMIYLYEKNTFKGDMTVSYHLLSGDNANYSGMAKTYQSYLTDKGMEKRDNASEIRLSVETIGTSLYDATLLGFTYEAQVKYTTYAQNEDVLNYFIDNGIDNISLSLVGWQKYGLDSMVGNKVRLSGVLGSKASFRNLLKFGEEKGIDIIPEAELLFVNNDKMFDGFSSNSDSVRQLDSTLGGISDFDFATQQYYSLNYAVSPTLYNKNFDSFFGGYKKLGTENVSLSSVGTYLNSDYAKKHSANRDETLRILTEYLDKIKSDYSMTFDGGNAYVLPFASNIKDIPTECSNYLGESYSVPFLQMVISGYASYSSNPINLLDDNKTGVLRCIETATSPDFIVTVDNVEKMKNTIYNKYYSTRFDVQKEQMIETYNYINDALKVAEGSALVSHSKIADGVFVSLFGNGAKVYVNYNSSDYTGGNITVPAQSYFAAV